MAGTSCRTSGKRLITPDSSSTTTSKLKMTLRKYLNAMMWPGYESWRTECLTRSTQTEIISLIATKFRSIWLASLTPRSCKNPQTSTTCQQWIRLLKWVFTAPHSGDSWKIRSKTICRSTTATETAEYLEMSSLTFTLKQAPFSSTSLGYRKRNQSQEVS